MPQQESGAVRCRSIGLGGYGWQQRRLFLSMAGESSRRQAGGRGSVRSTCVHLFGWLLVGLAPKLQWVDPSAPLSSADPCVFLGVDRFVWTWRITLVFALSPVWRVLSWRPVPVGSSQSSARQRLAVPPSAVLVIQIAMGPETRVLRSGSKSLRCGIKILDLHLSRRQLPVTCAIHSQDLY